MPRKSKLKSTLESDPKGEVMKRLRRYRGIFTRRIEDTATSGIPDIYVAGNRKSTWWEVKLGRPYFDSKEIQRITAEQLDLYGGYCRYIIFEMDADESNRRVSIARPSDIDNPKRWEQVGGWDYDWVIEYILRAHR